MDRNYWRQGKSDGPNFRKGYGEALCYPQEEGNFGNMPFGKAAEQEGWITLLGIDTPYVVTNHLTETKDNSSTIAGGAGGILWTTNATPSDNDDQAVNGLRTVTATANRMYRGVIRLKQSSVANMGLRFGCVSSGGTEFFTGAPTDGFYWAKAKNSAALTFEVVENGNASVQTTTFKTTLGGSAAAVSMVDDTDTVIAFEVFLGTSTTTRGRLIINGIETNLSSTVATALYTLLNTTAPTLLGHLGTRVNGTTQRVMTVQYAWIGCWRS